MHNNSKLYRVTISKSHRSGQALLLSVLIMVFIVLLGTTFISIVASNMSNTARTGAKDEARQAAKAGVLFADKQLSGSVDGLRWRPDQSATGSTYYYTAFDRAQGWSQEFYDSFLPTTTTPTPAKARFVKYPNPNGDSVASAQNTSNFMLRVSQVESGDADVAGDTKIGDIRIESIGFASDDLTAYYRVVAYKKGPANNPLTAAMRSISNWNFSSGSVPHATIIKSTSDTVFTIANAESEGLLNNDVVTVFDPVTGQVGNGEIGSITTNTNVPYPTTSTVTLKAALDFTPSPRSIIQKASIFGFPDSLQVQFDNATDTPVKFHVSAAKSLAGNNVNTAGSVWVNGGLIWSGTDFLTHLVADTPGNVGSNIKVSAVFTKTTNADVKASAGDAATAVDIPASSADANYNTNALVTAKLIEDGANRLSGSSAPTRQVKEFTPPDITAGGEGFGRYRQMTQYSPSTVAGIPQGAAYGYGQGIYINNPQDVEKKDNLAAMTQSDLQKLWYDDGTINSEGFQRAQVPSSASATNKSLEQQHMRGWVSPDQFVPRGAEVVINNDATITINLDPLADNTAGDYAHANFASGSPTPNPVKAWRNPDGSLAGDSATGGVYSRTIAWPANGTIFAEGNVRIRGAINVTAGGSPAPSSLTVVSMNNIYIEGSLKLDGNKKVLLLAKKNVIVNPTLALAPVQAVTTLSADASGATDTISVNSTANFKVGDYVTFAYGNAPVKRIVSLGADSMTFDSPMTTSTSAARGIGYPVYTAFDPRADSGYYTTGYTQRPYNTAIRLTRQSDVLQRRAWFAPGNAPANLRLAFRHSAQYKKALTLQMNEALAKGVPSTTDDAQKHTDLELAAVTNKALEQAYQGQSVITPGPDTDNELRNKYLKIKYNETSYVTDSGGNETATTNVDTDLFAVDRLKANQDTHSTGSYPYQVNVGAPDDRYAAADVSLGHLLKQMIDRHATVTTTPTASLTYDTTHWRYGELTPDDATQTITGINAAGARIENNYWNMLNGYENIDGTTAANKFDTGDTGVVGNNTKPRYYFMASVGNKANFTTNPPTTPPNVINPDFGDADTSTMPLRESYYPTPADGFSIPMATSVWLWMNNQQAILTDNVFNTSLNSFGNVLQFGFSPLFVNRDAAGDPIVTDAPYADYADWEDALTSDQYFYQPRNITTGVGVENITNPSADNHNDANYKTQAEYDSLKAGNFRVHYTLDSRLIENVAANGSADGSNDIAMSLDNALVDPNRNYTVQDYFTAKTGYDQDLDKFASIPYYRLSNLKLQQESVDNSTHELGQLGTAKMFDINAYVYAQEGGWQIIPGTYFDADVKNGEDLNRDGVVSQGEHAAAYRYHRYNYQIVFTGAIMENQTASMDHVKAWTDKWATVKTLDGEQVSTFLSKPLVNDYNSDNPHDSNFNTILYYYDPTAASGVLSDDPGFHAPVASGGLIYQG